ncbi:MAG: uncharacterized membrane protein YjjB (DUF3815 family), partial [Myxococcota bacterium]
DAARVVRLGEQPIDFGTLAELQSWEASLTPNDATALTRLETILDSRKPIRPTLDAFGWGLATTTTAMMLGTSWVDPIVAGLVGELVRRVHRWLELAGFRPVALLVVSLIAGLVGGISTLVGGSEAAIALSAVIFFVPGLGLTTAMSEAAAGHWNSGNTRLIGVVSEAVQLATGLMMSQWLLGEIPQLLTTGAGPDWWLWAAIVLSPVGFAILLRCRPIDYLPVVVVSTVGYLVAEHVGGTAGAGLAAFAIGLGAVFFHRLMDIPRLSLTVPGILLLVPGLLSVRGVQYLLAHDVAQGAPLIGDAHAAACALAIGLWVAFAAARYDRVNRGRSVLKPQRARTTL